MGDFGTFFERKNTSAASTFSGTLFYMSPELLQTEFGQRSNYNASKADVFSLGKTAFVAACLEPVQNCERGSHLDTYENDVRLKVRSLGLFRGFTAVHAAHALEGGR